MNQLPRRGACLRRVCQIVTALAAVSVSVNAQTAASSSSPGPKEEVVALSKFEVSTTQGKGYVATNAATGFKTNQELIKIPQSVTVVTRDLIDDIGATKTSDVLQFAGASQFYRGESIRLRGARALNPYMDDAIENVPYSDNVNIDSYEVIRGPAGVLYANASVSGVVLKSTKKPLPFSRNTISFSVKDWGLHRTEIDSTGPVGQLGDAKLSYRVAAAYQDGDAYFKNVEDQRFAVHPTLQVDLKNTTVRAAFDYVDVTSIAGGQSFVMPDGKLYTGAGRSEAYYPKGIMENHNQVRQRIAMLHRFGGGWEAKFSASHLRYVRKGTNVLPNNLNLQTGLFNLFARRNYQRQENWVVNGDVLGNYYIGPIANQSAAGFTLTDEVNRAAFLNNAAFGVQGFPIANPQMDRVVVPSYDSYAPPSSVGSWTNNRRSTYYYQHQADLIKDRLIVVAGVSAAALQINDVPNITARTTAGGTRIVNFEENLRRIGVVVNVTKDIALYGLDSTTFAPQGNSNTRDYFGVLLPAQVGSGKEFGVKTSLFDGRLSATVASFDMELTNVAVLAGTLSPITGISYFVATGLQKQKGWDASIAYSPIPEWQILVTGYKGTTKDQNGNTINNTYGSLFSFFTRYEFSDGSMKGFSFGGGGSKTGGNIFTSLGGYILPAGSTQTSITMESVWNMTAFAAYKVNKNWTVRLNIENLLDKAFVLGAQTPIFCDPSPPRTFQLSAVYKF
jgi:iron complex outermembrane receptor protein